MCRLGLGRGKRGFGLLKAAGRLKNEKIRELVLRKVREI